MTEINKKLDLAMVPPTNNDGKPYILPLDIYKEGYSGYNISNWFKGRVGDNGTPFAIRWYSHGRLLNIQGMRPFIEGQVGDYTIDDSDPDNVRIDMAEDASSIHIVGDVDDTQAGGIAIYRLINQAFPKSGIFYGKIGFMGTQDDGTLVNTGVDIVFKVLDGHMNMLGARKFYVTELEKAWLEMQAKFKQYNQEYKDTTTKQAEQFKQDTEKALADLNTKIANEIKRAEDTLGDTQATIDNNIASLKRISATCASIMAKLDADDVIDQKTFDENNKLINSRIDAIDGSVDKKLSDLSIQVQYLDLASLQSKYPQGATGVFILPNGHTASFENGSWQDSGQVSLIGGLKYYNVFNQSDVKAPFDDFDTLEGNTAVSYASKLTISNNPVADDSVLIVTLGNEEGGNYYQEVINTYSSKKAYRSGWKNKGDLKPTYSDWSKPETREFFVFDKQRDLKQPYDSIDTPIGNQTIIYKKGIKIADLSFYEDQDRIVITSGCNLNESGFLIQKLIPQNGTVFFRYGSRSKGKTPYWSDWINTQGKNYRNVTSTDVSAPYNDLSLIGSNEIVAYNTQANIVNSPFKSNNMIVITDGGANPTQGSAYTQKAISQVDGKIYTRNGWRNSLSEPVSYNQWLANEQIYKFTFASADEINKIDSRYLHLDWPLGNQQIIYGKGIELADSPISKDHEKIVITNGCSLNETGTVYQFLIPSDNLSPMYRTGFRNQAGKSPNWNNWKQVEPDVLPSLACFDTFGIVGDSYSAGLVKPDPTKDFHYNATKYQWGSMIAKRNGNHCVNFSVSGYTAKDIVDNKLSEIQKVKPLDLYCIVLGINDGASYSTETLGTVNDIKDLSNSFYGNYARIIKTIQYHAPSAKIILFTSLASFGNKQADFDQAIKDIGNSFGIPVINVKDDNYFSSDFYAKTHSTGHPTPLGYALIATHLEKLMSKCLIDHYDYFAMLNLDNDSSKTTELKDLVQPSDMDIPENNA